MADTNLLISPLHWVASDVARYCNAVLRTCSGSLLTSTDNKEVRSKKYPSDTSREQFQIIKPLLESARKRTKPRTVDLYEV